MAKDQQSGLMGAEELNRAAGQRARVEGLPAETTLVHLQPELPRVRKGEESALIKAIPIEIDVAIPIRRFQVRNVLGLAAGQVVETRWAEGEDVPLAAHGTQLAWTEIEVMDQKLAVRITRLA